MSLDQNNNGIPDKGEVSFHLRSFLIGGFLFLALGSSSIALAKVMLPENEYINRFGQWFAGTSCDHVTNKYNQKLEQKEKELLNLKKIIVVTEKALICYQVGASIHGISDTDCKEILEK